ncbi:Oidioi.mRNA.OKI2018_I69.chr2.g5877.t1.cds [Oikopleura dioica]|uniref:Oidioi.mRNA.OKI2018_I69.chr2.g5877.t1.cds n=1 Tax=Oikopleura dioica TaxID=34765 RepID=A0ABN7T7C4_OIKDI|nr:Oidioi.mRNA.OKI2018_I69.chr2.g5877.t1.cds [Oikopleura dioica]
MPRKDRDQIDVICLECHSLYLDGWRYHIESIKDHFLKKHYTMMMTNNPKRQWEIIHNNIEIIPKGSQYDSLFHVSDYIIDTFHQVIWGPRLRISIRFRYRGKHSAHPEPNYTILPISELKWSQKLKMFIDAAISKTKDDRKKRKLIKTMRDRNRHGYDAEEHRNQRLYSGCGACNARENQEEPAQPEVEYF